MKIKTGNMKKKSEIGLRNTNRRWPANSSISRGKKRRKKIFEKNATFDGLHKQLKAYYMIGLK